MTRADKIRKMTDEELAKYLDYELAGTVCLEAEGMDCEYFSECWFCRLAWLKEEVDDENM